MRPRIEEGWSLGTRTRPYLTLPDRRRAGGLAYGLDRLELYLEKALREAKVNTSWIDQET